MEKTDDILREMRKDMPRVVDAKVILRNYADRIEAAHEQELIVERSKAAGEGYATGKQSVTNCNQLNQVMSDVLKFIMDVIEKNYAKETTAKDALFRIYGCAGITLKEIERKEKHEND